MSSVQRMALLQSRMNELRERDFAQGKQLAGIVHSLTSQALAQPVPVAVPLAQANALAASPTGNVPVVVASPVDPSVAAVVPKVTGVLAQIAEVIKGVHGQMVKQVVAPPPPPVVKLDTKTQQQLEDEIRSLRKEQEQREMKFMQEAAVATANEIARDKQSEERKATIAHREHVTAVAMTKMHEKWLSNNEQRMAASEDAPPRAQTEVERVLQKALEAQSAHGKEAKAKKAVAVMVKAKPLTPVQREALKVKEAAETKLQAEEKAKEDKMAAAFEAHQEQETSMIEQRQPVGGVAQKRAQEADKAAHKVKLSAQQEAEVELQKRVERMIRHSVKEDAKKRLQQRVEKMMAKLSKTRRSKTTPWSGKPELSHAKAEILSQKKDAPLTPAQQEALKVKEAAEARLKAEEKAKEDKMAAAFEAHQERETSMIEKRQTVGGAAASKRAQEAEEAGKAAHKVTLSAKAEAKLQLQQRVEKMIRHTDIAVAEKQMQERVQHAKTLLKEEASVLKKVSSPVFLP